MMTLANYGIGSSKNKHPNSAKSLSKSLQIRNRAESTLKQCLNTQYCIPEEKRGDIISSIKEYYSRVPFNVVIWNKYQTKQCIADSVLLLGSGFNPFSACKAFKLVEKMLVNLVQLPWHGEFRQIHTYSGEFRSAISGPLIGIEEVFKAAGFKQNSTDKPLHLILPDDKMPQTDDGESVTSVIFDCMLAQVVLTDIIEVFRSCCKMTKHTEDLLVQKINCYSWIQIYFQERTHQVTERACSNIQESLNNISNYFSKLDLSDTARLSPRYEPSSMRSLTTSDIGRLSNLNDNTRMLTAQERTREFLARRSAGDENLLKLSSNTKLQDLAEGNRTDAYKSNNHVTRQASNQQSNSTKNLIGLGESLTRSNFRDNGHEVAVADGQYNQRQAPYNRFVSKQIDSYDNVDSNRMSSIEADHSIKVERPHNDREPLIPRQDRRFVAQRIQAQGKLNSAMDNNFSRLSPENNLLSDRDYPVVGSRYRCESPYYESCSSSHQHQSTNNALRSQVSKYDKVPHRVNVSRGLDRVANSRSHWSCGSCTFNNLAISEICEMCRNRRPTR